MANVSELAACLVCGQVLPASQGRGRRRQYCSERCRDRARRARANAERRNPVKNSLTTSGRQGYGDADDQLPDAEARRVSAAVADAARLLVAELDGPGGPDTTGHSTRQSTADSAVRAARDLATAAEAALQEAVDRARAGGQSWSDIGRMLGTSRQAAFQRFGHPVDPRTGVAMSRTVSPAATRHAAGGAVSGLRLHPAPSDTARPAGAPE